MWGPKWSRTMTSFGIGPRENLRPTCAKVHFTCVDRRVSSANLTYRSNIGVNGCFRLQSPHREQTEQTTHDVFPKVLSRGCKLGAPCGTLSVQSVLNTGCEEDQESLQLTENSFEIKSALHTRKRFRARVTQNLWPGERRPPEPGDFAEHYAEVLSDGVSGLRKGMGCVVGLGQICLSWAIINGPRSQRRVFGT